MSLDRLLEEAGLARSRAYAPYSNYLVGACVEAEDGSLHIGCNVENLSYGLTVCAERNAIAAMVASGHRKFVRAVVVTADGGAPCGACRQVLLEFACDLEATVMCIGTDGSERSFRVAELIPAAFASTQVKRGEASGD
jgi:cytidine deaminase